MNFADLFTLPKLIEMAAIISALAGISAALIMKKVTRHFGTGIVATGYRFTAGGVAFIGLAMFIESIIQYLQLSLPILTLAKEILLVAGTYIIVIGTKLTADKLDNLTNNKKG